MSKLTVLPLSSPFYYGSNTLIPTQLLCKNPGLVSESPFPLFPPPPTSSVCPHPKSTSNQSLFPFSPGTALAPATASLGAGSNSHVFQVLGGSCSTQNI